MPNEVKAYHKAQLVALRGRSLAMPSDEGDVFFVEQSDDELVESLLAADFAGILRDVDLGVHCREDDVLVGSLWISGDEAYADPLRVYRVRYFAVDKWLKLVAIQGLRGATYTFLGLSWFWSLMCFLVASVR